MFWEASTRLLCFRDQISVFESYGPVSIPSKHQGAMILARNNNNLVGLASKYVSLPKTLALDCIDCLHRIHLLTA